MSRTVQRVISIAVFVVVALGAYLLPEIAPRTGWLFERMALALVLGLLVAIFADRMVE